MARSHSPALLATLLLLTGCGSDYQDRGWAQPRPLGSEWARPPAGTAVPATQPSQAAGDPRGVITLRQALTAALRESPELASFSYSVRSAEADALQASLLPNPELGVEVENFGGSGPRKGFDSAESTVALSQLIELGGKRGKRKRAAQLATDMAGWEYETKRMDVLTEVTLRFVDVAAAQRRMELAQQEVELADRVFQTVGERVEAGKVSPVERTKARVLLMSNRASLEKNRRQLAAARQSLAATWGSSNVMFEAVDADLNRLAAIPAREALLTRITQNPDLARWTTELARRRADLAVARSGSVPDVTVAAGARYFAEDNDTAAVAGISIPIPIFDQGQGEIRKSRMEMLKALADQRATQARVAVALEEAYQNLSSAHGTAVAFRDEVVPGAQEAFEAAEASYTAGKLSYMDVLDGQRTLHEVRGQYLDALVDYHKAVAQMERLVGERLGGVELDVAVQTGTESQEAAKSVPQE